MTFQSTTASKSSATHALNQLIDGGKHATGRVNPKVAKGIRELIRLSADIKKTGSLAAIKKVGGKAVLATIKNSNLGGIMGGQKPSILLEKFGSIKNIIAATTGSANKKEELSIAVATGTKAIQNILGQNPAALAKNISGSVLNDISIAGVLTNVADGTFGAKLPENIDLSPKILEALDPTLSEQVATAESIEFIIESEVVENTIETPKDLEQDIPSPWAEDLTNAKNHAKFAFLFAVKFVFNQDFQETLDKNAESMTFLVKNATRPTVEIEYEDTNMYNFRTKVAKKSIYQPGKIQFYDDMANQTSSFYKKYLELMIPNMRIVDPTIYEHSQFEFEGGLNSSSLQSLPGESGHKGILKRIEYYQILDWGKSMNVMIYHNPKITSVDISDTDMEANALCDVTLDFAYDGLNILTNLEDEVISLDPSFNEGYDMNHGGATYNFEYKADGIDDVLDHVSDLPPKLSTFNYTQAIKESPVVALELAKTRVNSVNLSSQKVVDKHVQDNTGQRLQRPAGSSSTSPIIGARVTNAILPNRKTSRYA
jgi:hypothetical protein